MNKIINGYSDWKSELTEEFSDSGTVSHGHDVQTTGT